MEKECSDEADEKNCNIVSLAQGYNRKIPPATRSGHPGRGNHSGPTKALVEVVVEATVFQISRLNEKTGTMNLGITLDTFWFDNRVRFNFLKADPRMNNIPTVSSSTEFVVWTPTLVFRNTNGALATSRSRADINDFFLGLRGLLRIHSSVRQFLLTHRGWPLW